MQLMDTDRLNHICFDRIDGSTLVSTSADHSVRLWNTDTGEALNQIEGNLFNFAFALVLPKLSYVLK